MLTDNTKCPIHNPECRIDVGTEVLACELNKWANKEWFEERFSELARFVN